MYCITHTGLTCVYWYYRTLEPYCTESIMVQFQIYFSNYIFAIKLRIFFKLVFKLEFFFKLRIFLQTSSLQTSHFLPTNCFSSIHIPSRSGSPTPNGDLFLLEPIYKLICLITVFEFDTHTSYIYFDLFSITLSSLFLYSSYVLE